MHSGDVEDSMQHPEPAPVLLVQAGNNINVVMLQARQSCCIPPLCSDGWLPFSEALF
jgi:hypothetical protein